VITKTTLGDQTNNYAEYMAVIRAMELCTQHPVDQVWTFYCDSQLSSEADAWVSTKSKRLRLSRSLSKPNNSLVQFKKWWDFIIFRREFNKEADALANQGLDTLTLCKRESDNQRVADQAEHATSLKL
jgi:ribonuclease HI